MPWSVLVVPDIALSWQIAFELCHRSPASKDNEYTVSLHVFFEDELDRENVEVSCSMVELGVFSLVLSDFFQGFFLSETVIRSTARAGNDGEGCDRTD